MEEGISTSVCWCSEGLPAIPGIPRTEGAAQRVSPHRLPQTDLPQLLGLLGQHLLDLLLLLPQLGDLLPLLLLAGLRVGRTCHHYVIV